ncbi:tetratricopeptide repeat-containing sensor histidine kinase [Algoriphagus marinus]|uniref:tetratricopeptide repeat-containing sensor histidine kinase n=1 Tax=Algoriphagus marinus TaxID=1925762 RepID=UPI00094B821F|nr:tetratricopeptide repeat protein [Algoriphagus marinus]
MKKIYFVLLFLSLIVNSPAFTQSQRELLDSLKTALNQAENPTDQATILSELVWNYVPISMDSAIIFGERGIETAKPLNDPALLSQLYSDLGYAWMEKGELVNARENYQNALKLRVELGDSAKIYGTITNLGSVYQRDFQSDSAMVNYLKALAFFERTGNERYADFVKNNIGVIYLEMRNYPKALEILKQVAEYRKSQEDDYNLAMTYTNLGNVYKNLNQFNDAEKTYLEALEIFKDFEDIYYTATTFNNLATLYNTQKKSNLAIDFAEKGLELADQAGATYDYALIESNLAQSYNDLKDYPKSREYYLRALRNFESQNAEDDIASMYLLMSPVYAALGMPDSAAFYTSEYVTLNKKIAEQEIQQLTSDLETRYQTEKKDAALAQQELEIRNRTIQLFGSLALAIILAIVGYLLYSQQKLKNQQLKQEGELRAALAQIETQNKLQEQRLLISRDLHDNIGAQLTFIISAIENLKYFDPIKDQLTQRYDTIANFTKQTITELRDTIWAMNAGQVSWEQLSGRISDYLQRARLSDEKVSFEFLGGENLDSNLRFDSASGIQIYRILQEAIQNAIKYSEASAIQVSISQEKDTLKLQIKDNGKGFEESKITPGNGLFNMRKRAEELKGDLNIQSKTGEGTSITLTWPIS